MRTGVTCIVLALIEDDFLRRSLSIVDPVRVIKEISHDPDCKAGFPMERGGRRTAVEVQEDYL